MCSTGSFHYVHGLVSSKSFYTLYSESIMGPLLFCPWKRPPNALQHSECNPASLSWRLLCFKSQCYTPSRFLLLLLCERVVWWQISFPRIYYLLCILRFSHNDPICIWVEWGAPPLPNLIKKIMRPLKAHKCVSTMKRVYNRCKCEVFLLCGAQRFDTHLFCWVKSASLFALRI